MFILWLLLEALKRNEDLNVEGILSQIKTVPMNLAFLRIIPLDINLSPMDVPIYGRLDERTSHLRQGSVVRINISGNVNYAGKNLRQEISWGDDKYVVEISMKEVNEIKKGYRRMLSLTRSRYFRASEQDMEGPAPN